MATVILIHSIYGLGALERTAAAQWAAAGHRTVAPDLFDGATAGSVEEGFAIQERVGWDAIFARAEAACADLPDGAVLAGISMGAEVVSRLWRQRPRAAGLLLLHGIYTLDAPPRPGVPLQLHLAEPDPFEEEFVPDWTAEVEQAGYALETFRYPGLGHIFSNPDLADYAPDAARLVWERSSAFLDRVGGQ